MAPAFAASTAATAPMPDDAPVTTTRWPVPSQLPAAIVSRPAVTR